MDDEKYNKKLERSGDSIKNCGGEVMTVVSQYFSSGNISRYSVSLLKVFLDQADS